MKKIFWLIGILAIIVIIYFSTKKISGLTKMEFDVDSISFDVQDWKDFLKLIATGVDGEIDLLLQNFSGEKYSFDNIYVEVYSLNGTLIAYQKTANIAPVEIQPNIDNVVKLPFYFKNAFFVQIAKQLDSNVLSIASNYFSTGKFGTSVIVKGYISKGEAKIPFNIEKQI